MLAALMAEELDYGNRMFFVAEHFKGQQPKPLRIPRPGVPVRDPGMSMGQVLGAFPDAEIVVVKKHPKKGERTDGEKGPA